MGFSSIQKTASTGSSATGALVGANSLQPRKSGKNGCTRQYKNRFVIMPLFGDLQEHGSKFGEHNPVFWRIVFERKGILPESVPYNSIFHISAKFLTKKYG
jgi:hypothetical protein